MVHKTQEIPMHTAKVMAEEPCWLTPLEDLAKRQKSMWLKRWETYLYSAAKTSSHLGWALDQICTVPQAITSFAFHPKDFQYHFIYWHHCYFFELGQCCPIFKWFHLPCIFHSNDYSFKKQTLLWKVFFFFFFLPTTGMIKILC